MNIAKYLIVIVLGLMSLSSMAQSESGGDGGGGGTTSSEGSTDSPSTRGTYDPDGNPPSDGSAFTEMANETYRGDFVTDQERERQDEGTSPIPHTVPCYSAACGEADETEMSMFRFYMGK